MLSKTTLAAALVTAVVLQTTPLMAQNSPIELTPEMIESLARALEGYKSRAHLALENADELSLDTRQVNQIRDAMDEHERASLAIAQRSDELLDKLPLPNFIDPLDEELVRQVFQDRGLAEADRFIAKYRLDRAVYEVLSPAQRHMLDDLTMKRMVESLNQESRQ